MDVVTEMKEVVDEHPLATLGAALLVGYTLGGGLAARATRRWLWTGLRLGMRLAALPALQREVVELASTLGQNLRAATEDDDDERAHEEDGDEDYHEVRIS